MVQSLQVLKEDLGLGQAKVLQITRWQHAVPTLPVGHFKLRETVEQKLTELRGVSILSRELGGVGLADRIAFAEKLCSSLGAGKNDHE